MSETQNTSKLLNPFELQKLINQNYRITADEGIELNSLMTYYGDIRSNYESDTKDLKGEELDKKQTEYNYDLYSKKYKILEMQKKISYKSFHIKRIGYVRDIMLAKESKEYDKIKELFSYLIDNLTEEIITETSLSMELLKTIPHLRNSCINYCYDVYKEVQTEKIKLEMQPLLKEIKERYNKQLNEVTENAKTMPNKTPEEIETIISKKKELLDAKSSAELLAADNKLKQMTSEKNKLKKADVNYNKILTLLDELLEYFKRNKTDGSMLDAESTSVRKLEQYEKIVIILSEQLKKFNNNELEQNMNKIAVFQEEKAKYSKYQINKEGIQNNPLYEKINKLLKHNCLSGLLSGDITLGQLSGEDGKLLFDDLLIYLGIETEKISKSKSS